MLYGKEGDRPTACSFDYHRAAKLLLPSHNTQRVQPVHIARRAPGNLLGSGHHIQRSRRRLDDRRAGDPKLRRDGRAISLPAASPQGIAVTPAAGLIKLVCQTGVVEAVSASQAYTLSCSVATNTKLCTCVPTVTPGIYNGCAKIGPSTGSEKSLPNVDEFTFAVVRIVSVHVLPGSQIVVVVGEHGDRRSDMRNGKGRGPRGTVIAGGNDGACGGRDRQRL